MYCSNFKQLILFLCLRGGLGDKYRRSKIKPSFLKADTSARLSFLLLEKLLYHSMNLTVAWHKSSTQGLTIKLLNPHLCNKKANNLIFWMLISQCLAVETWTLYLYTLYLPVFLLISCCLLDSTEKEWGAGKRLQGITWLNSTWALNYGIIFLGPENFYCKTLQLFITDKHKH